MVGNRFAFASEIKALFELRDFNARLNRSALPWLFTFGYLSAEETLYKNVYKLLPGHCLCLELDSDNARPQITQYWELNSSAPERSPSEADCISRFRDLFAETVRSHLMSDVPLGGVLRGGVDSGSIAAVMASFTKEHRHTFAL